MKLVWIFSIALVLALNFQEAATFKVFKCPDHVETEATWLSNDCEYRFKCQDNRMVSRKGYTCASNSHCDKGQCVCDDGWKLSGTTCDGELRSCKAVSSANVDTCEYNGMQFKKGQTRLSLDCTETLYCQSGVIIFDSHTIPENTKCVYGILKCVDGFVPLLINPNGLLETCKESEGCKVGNQIHKEGSVWISDDCSQVSYCFGGQITSKDNSCPKNSHCDRGKCVCNAGFDKLEFNGKLYHCLKECKDGFIRKGDTCLSFEKDRKLSFIRAQEECRKKGARLFIPPFLFQVSKKIAKDNALKGGKYFVLGSPQLKYSGFQVPKLPTVLENPESIPEFESEEFGFGDLSKETPAFEFISNIMTKYGVAEGLCGKAIKRFSGQATIEDWNFKSPLSSLCLAIGDNGPELIACSDKIGYICEHINDGDYFFNEVFWSRWYDGASPNNKGEEESVTNILKKYNSKYTGEQDRLCQNPIAMECRQKGTNILFSKESQNGLILKDACQNQKITCLNTNQKAGKRCPNFEVRFQCMLNDLLDCRIDMVRKNCENYGKKCVNHRTGAVCMNQGRRGNLQRYACELNSKKYNVYGCRATGDPHYQSLDGLRFNFMGTCHYDFVSTCDNFVPSETFPSFKVVSKNYKRNKRSRASWTKSFDLFLGTTNYTFNQGQFLVNDMLVNSAGYSDNNIDIIVKVKGRRSSLDIRTNFCMRITWDNMFGLFVYVPDSYKNKICGLCGNFDGNINNDLRKPGSNKRLSHSEIGKKFLVAGSSETHCQVIPPPQCSQENQEKFGKPEYCGVFDVNGESPIVKAIRKLKDAGVNLDSVAAQFKECIDDLCWDATTDRCNDLEEFIDKIHDALGIIDADMDQKWRLFAKCETSQETLCSNLPNMIYTRRHKPACQNSCAEPDKSVDCRDAIERSGCICKPGYLFDAKLNCVTQQECSTCKVESDNGKIFFLDHDGEYVAEACERILSCQKGQLKERKLASCSPHAECVDNGRTCRCREGYIGSGTQCTKLTCGDGFTAIGNKCYKFVSLPLDWQAAAISCGAVGSVLARYDTSFGTGLANFLSKIPPSTGAWIGGNSNLLKRNQRGDKSPTQADPPKILDLSGNGCFHANTAQSGKFTINIKSNCNEKLPFICEYDNKGNKPVPAELNQCKIFKSEKINPCSGGKQCTPLLNHFTCVTPEQYKDICY